MLKHNMFVWVKRFFMVVVPVLLVLLEWSHPFGFSKNVYDGLHHVSEWWQQIHILQSFLFAGITIAALFLTWNNNSFFGILSKVFIGFFAVGYLVFDSTAGTAVGFIINYSKQNPSLDLETSKRIVQALYTDKVIGGSNSFFSLLGSYSWLFGIGSAILAIFGGNKWLPLWKVLPPLLLLAISAFSLFVGHYYPYGPIAFASFALAAIWFDFFDFKL